MAHMSFKWRAILPVVLSLLIGVVLFVSVAGFLFYDSVSKETREDARDESILISSRIDLELIDILTVARTFAVMLEEQVSRGTADRSSWIDTCKGILQDNDTLDGIALYFEPGLFDGRDAEYANTDFHDSTGIFAPSVFRSGNAFSVTTKSLTEHQRSGIYRVAQDGREFAANPVRIGTSSSVEFAIPVRVNNRPVGFVAVTMNFHELQEDINNLSFNLFPNAFAFVATSDGSLVAHTSQNMIGQNVFDISESGLTGALKSAMGSRMITEASVYATSVNGVCSFIITPLTIIEGQEPWLVAVAIPNADSNSLIMGTLLTMGGVVVLSILASLAILYMIINNSSKALTAMNEELFTAAQSVLSAATQISGSGGVLAQGGVEQAASIEETSATASQASVMIQQNADNTEIISGLANEALEAANDGLSRVQDMIASMRELESSSEEIAKIIAIIDNIAFQTNILALNASVEAARVGDAGKGFSVVAEEVRNLASRSTEAASNTSAIVERNLQLSRQGVTGSAEVNNALQEIVSENAELNTLVSMINASSREQLEGIKHINIALSQMEDVTQSNAAVAEENSAAASELEVQAQDLNHVQELLSSLVLGSGGEQVKATKSAQTRQQPPSGGFYAPQGRKPTPVRGQLPSPTRRGR